MKRQSQISSLGLLVGLVLLWVAERIVDRGPGAMAATAAGLALLAMAFALRTWRMTRAQRADERAIEGLLLGLHALALAAVALYYLQSDTFAKFSGYHFENQWPKLAGILAVLWPALMAAAQIPTLLVELAAAAMARAPKLEVARAKEALWAGLGLAFALTFAFALQYVVTERDVKKDFSYFRTARPGEATKHLVQSFDEKVEVVLFYPPASDVAELVIAYFDELRQDAPMMTVTRLDSALEPIKSKELGVSSNGAVVIKKGARKETLFTGTEVEKSRTQLRSLDQEVQKRFLQVAKAKRTVYFTSGHGERTQEALGAATPRGTIELLHRTLQDQNFEIKVLSSAEGLGADVPRDAAAVFVLGPQRAFTEPEAQTLATYEKRGGKLFIALDPEARLVFDELLKPLGVSFKAEVLAGDTSIARINGGLSDRQNLGTRSFSSHPSVTYASRSQSPVLVIGAGPLDELPAHDAALSIDFAVRTVPSTWNDANSNFQYDAPAEVRKGYALMAAISKRGTSNKIEDEMRALVLGDSDAVTDAILGQVQGNQLLLVDGLKWLLGDEQLQGATNSEQDVAMTRTREQDNLWFYGTTVLAPLAIVGLGALVRRRTKKKEVKS